MSPETAAHKRLRLEERAKKIALALLLLCVAAMIPIGLTLMYVASINVLLHSGAAGSETEIVFLKILGVILLIVAIPLLPSILLYRKQNFKWSIIASSVLIVLLTSGAAGSYIMKRIRTARNIEYSKELDTIPPGFLVPDMASIPQPFEEASHSYRKKSYHVFYKDPHDTQLGTASEKFIQIIGYKSELLCESPPPYLSHNTVQTFSYKGFPGQITYTPPHSSELVSYTLFWRGPGECIEIFYAFAKQKETRPEDVINILKSMTRTK